MDRGQAMSLRICDENIDNSVNSLISFIFTTTVPLILLILFIFLFFIYLFIYLFILNLVPALPRETQGTGNEPNHESSRAEFQYGVLRWMKGSSTFLLLSCWQERQNWQNTLWKTRFLIIKWCRRRFLENVNVITPKLFKLYKLTDNKQAYRRECCSSNSSLKTVEKKKRASCLKVHHSYFKFKS